MYLALVPAPARQRALLPTPNGVIEGWMDEDAAAAAGQLFGTGPSGMLVVDGHELLSSTARVVGTRLGELHFKTWMALITLFVNDGMPEDGIGQSTVGEFSRVVWGADKEQGGSNTRKIVGALNDLYSAQLVLPNYNFATQSFEPGIGKARLLTDLFVDETIQQAYDTPRVLEPDEIGRRLGGKGAGTLAWALSPRYAQRLAASELRRFDWTKAQQLRGAALALWLVFTSPRVPYRSMFGSEPTGLEHVDVPLSVEHCYALGVRNGADAGRRRTLNEAGARVCAADRSFVTFEAHGGRGRLSFLRVVRRRPEEPSIARPYGEQLHLERVEGSS